jgi:amino-acid N-acetyltransferase
MTTRRSIKIRAGAPGHAPKLHALILANMEEGHLLPRALDDLAAHADRFVVALRGPKVVGCAELAPLSGHVAEVRSLAVDPSARGEGIGITLVDAVRERALRMGFEKLCAFTHAPEYFRRLGFSMMPHRAVPEKIAADCVTCPRYGRCGQFAMVMALDALPEGIGSERAPAAQLA